MQTSSKSDQSANRKNARLSMVNISGVMVLQLAIVAALIWVLVMFLLSPPRTSGEKLTGKGAATPSDSDVDLVVTLVHGTIGWCSSWLHRGSNLRTHLNSTFPGRIVFRRVPWSGLNSFRARRNGAASLRRQIHDNAIRWPMARQFIVAHSHGGSLSIEALNDEECSKCVEGLVCMSTPFLTPTHYRLPSFSPSLQFLFDMASIYAIAISVGVMLHWLPLRSLLPDWVLERLTVLAISVHDGSIVQGLLHPTFPVFVLGWIAFPVIVVLSLGWLARRWAGRYETLVVDALREPRIEPDSVLILRQPGDEAAGAINGLHAVTWPLGAFIWLIGALLSRIDAARRRAKVSPFGRRWAGWSGVVSASLMAAAALVIAVSDHQGSGPLVLFAALDVISLTVVTTQYAMLVLLGALTTVATLIALAHFISLIPAIFSIGPEMLFAGSRLRVTAEAAPVGTWQVITIPMHARLVKEQPLVGSLWHSYLYESPAAIGEIGVWLQSRMLQQPSRPS
jgi:hypothetical protein